MNAIEQWIHEQRQQGNALYLILDAPNQPQLHQRLAASHPHRTPLALYAATSVAALQQFGPWLFELDDQAQPMISPLLETPDQNWGWLASAPPGQLVALASHWRERLLIGQRPNQALYRIHDSQVLGRALGLLSEEDIPAYLGPIHTVGYCYDGWRTVRNPAPGDIPAPAEPAWLNLPEDSTQVRQVLRENLHRYLLAEHTEAYANLAAQLPPLSWLDDLLQQAQAWHWYETDALHLLVTQALRAPDHRFPQRWHPQPGEAPLTHFERVRDELGFWAKAGAI